MDKNRERDERQAGISRRGFIKHTAVGGIAVAYTVGVGKFVASIVPDDASQKAYLKDVLPGDRVMMEREYVLMTEREKKQIVQMFIEDYKTASSK